MRMTQDDAIKMHECLNDMQKALAEAEKALGKYQRSLDQYNSIKRAWAEEEDRIDDGVGAVYAGIVGAKRNV